MRTHLQLSFIATIIFLASCANHRTPVSVSGHIEDYAVESRQYELFVFEYVQIDFPTNLTNMSFLAPIAAVDIDETGQFAVEVYACGSLEITNASAGTPVKTLSDRTASVVLEHNALNETNYAPQMSRARELFAALDAEFAKIGGWEFAPCDLTEPIARQRSSDE